MTEDEKKAGNYETEDDRESITLFTAWSNGGDFEGRACRKEFWLACVSGLLVMMGYALIGGIFTSCTANSSTASSAASSTASPFQGLLLLLAIPVISILILFMYISCSLCVRRLHDIGYGGLNSFSLFLAAPVVVLGVVPFGLFMPFMGIGIINGIAEFAKIDSSFGRLSLLYAICHFVVFLWLGFAKSKEGENKYGLNPKDEYK